jgi:hypothetical protein
MTGGGQMGLPGKIIGVIRTYPLRVRDERGIFAGPTHTI